MSVKVNGPSPPCAGEPTLTACSLAQRQDHPRVGGGTGVWMVIPISALGPSPRGRGNLTPRFIRD